MERDILLIGTMIAVLRKNFNLPMTKEQVFEGIRIAKQIGVDEAIAKEAGGEPANEEPIAEINLTATDGAGSYVEIVSKTITPGRTGIISKMEMASADYDNVQWRITINSKVVFEGKELPNATTLTLADVSVRGGKVFKVEAKDTDSIAHNCWADITGKEII